MLRRKSHVQLRLKGYFSGSVTVVSFSTTCVSSKAEDHVQTEPLVTQIMIDDSLIASFN